MGITVDIKSIATPVNQIFDNWYNSPNVGEKYVFFDMLLREECGVEVNLYSNHQSYHPVYPSSIQSVIVVDEEKYFHFLLRWS